MKSRQVNIANDNATITATNTVGIDAEKLSELIQAIKNSATDLSKEDVEVLESSLEVVKDETKSDKPRKGFLKTALVGLKTLKGTAELTAAVVALIQFVQPLL